LQALLKTNYSLTTKTAMNLTQPTRLDSGDNLTDELEALLESAINDYDAFWWNELSERDRMLTRSLCCSDTCDTMFVSGTQVYGFWNTQNGFEVWHLCPKSELVVYCTEQNTNLTGDDLEVFVAELGCELQGLEVRQSRHDISSVACQFLADNDCLKDAWANTRANIVETEAA